MPEVSKCLYAEAFNLKNEKVFPKLFILRKSCLALGSVT